MDAYLYIAPCEYVVRHCCSICGTHHGSAWLLDKIVRFFEDPDNQAAEAVTIPVFLNTPIMQEGSATIHRDGSVQLRVG